MRYRLTLSLRLKRKTHIFLPAILSCWTIRCVTQVGREFEVSIEEISADFHGKSFATASFHKHFNYGMQCKYAFVQEQSYLPHLPSWMGFIPTTVYCRERTWRNGRMKGFYFLAQNSSVWTVGNSSFELHKCSLHVNIDERYLVLTTIPESMICHIKFGCHFHKIQV